MGLHDNFRTAGKLAERNAPMSLCAGGRGIVALPTGAEDEETRTSVDLTNHPWAGARVKLTLLAKDEATHEGRSTTIDFVLPSIIPDSVDLSLTTVPSYWDVQFRLDHQLTSKWKLAPSRSRWIDACAV